MQAREERCSEGMGEVRGREGVEDLVPHLWRHGSYRTRGNTLAEELVVQLVGGGGEGGRGREKKRRGTRRKREKEERRIIGGESGREEKRREGVTHSYLPVLAHHVIWEGRRSRLRGVATVVLCCLQQTLCCTILTGREDEGGREEV